MFGSVMADVFDLNNRFKGAAMTARLKFNWSQDIRPCWRALSDKKGSQALERNHAGN